MCQDHLFTRRLVAVALLALVLATCRDAGPQVTNPVSLHVLSPNGPEGAALVRLEGGIDRVEATATGWLLTDVIADTTWVMVARDTPGELSFRIHVRAGGQLRDAQLIEVSGPDDTMRSQTAGYHVEIR
jgi:hypothetical protein